MAGICDKLGHFIRPAEAAEARVTALDAALAEVARLQGESAAQQDRVATAQASRVDLHRRRQGHLDAGEVDEAYRLRSEIARLDDEITAGEAAYTRLSVALSAAYEVVARERRALLLPQLDDARSDLASAAAELIAALDRLRDIEGKLRLDHVAPAIEAINGFYLTQAIKLYGSHRAKAA